MAVEELCATLETDSPNMAGEELRSPDMEGEEAGETEFVSSLSIYRNEIK